MKEERLTIIVAALAAALLQMQLWAMPATSARQLAQVAVTARAAA